MPQQPIDLRPADTAPGAPKLRQTYVSWIEFARRAEAMREYFGYDLFYIPPPYKAKYLKPLGYLVQAIKTFQIIKKTKPDVVWMHLPPSFILHVVFLCRFLLGAKFRIIADAHNAVLREPWIRFPGTSYFMNKTDAILAHNSEVASTTSQWGILPEKVWRLETRPPIMEGSAWVQGTGRPTIFVPCSFHSDEPVDALLDAARELPEADFLITGHLGKAKSLGYFGRASANVRFTGFISEEEYDELLKQCTMVVGLTTKPGIQLCAASEATGAGKPMVLSDFAILRELFWTGSHFVPNTGPGIAAGCREILAHYAQYQKDVLQLRTKRDARWVGQADGFAANPKIGLRPVGFQTPILADTLSPQT